MESSSPRRDFLLGLVFFGTLVLLVYYTIVLTGFSFREKTYRTVWFPDGSGLKEGDAVLVAGRQTGSVRSVDFFEERPQDRWIGVELEFDRPITLRRGYRIRITEFTLLGGRVVEIDPGPPGTATLPDDAELVGEIGGGALNLVGDLLEENREDIRAIVRNVRSLSDQVAEGQGVLGALVTDSEMRQELDDFFERANAVAEDLRAGKGTLGMLISDELVRERATALINDGATAAINLRKIAEDLAVGRGTFGALLTDETVRAEAVDLIANLDAASKALRTMLDDALEGRGLIGKVLSDEVMAAEAQKFVSDMSEVARRLRAGEGSLGKVLAKDEAYEELMSAMRLLNSSLEDAREAQPVGSFAGLLFGAF